MKTIVIYARKSLFTGKGDSIGAQIDTCKRFIDYKFAQEEYELKIFTDEGWSGKTTDRPEFNKMLKLIKQKKIQYIISYKLDRLGRTARDLHNFLYDIDKLNIIYLSATEPYDTTTSAGRFMISILAAMAQMERERLAERVKGGMMQLAKKGRWLGGQTPLGFDSIKEVYIDNSGKERQMMKLTANKKEIKIVKLLYDKYLELISMSQVKKWCIENSIKGKNGGEISTNTLKQILSSPIYVKSSSKVVDYLENQGINVFGEPNGNGMLTFNKTKEIRLPRNKSEWIAAVSKHKGIIDDIKWLQVQSQLELQSEKQIKSSGRKGTSDSALLSGIIKCAKCGSNMILKTGHKSKKNSNITYSYYVCNAKIDSYGHKCSNKNIRTDEADLAAISQMKLYNKKLLVKNLLVASKEINKDAELDKIVMLKDNIAEKEKGIVNLIKKLSLIDDESISNAILNKVSSLNMEIKKLKTSLNASEIKNNEETTIKVNIDSYIQSLKNFNENIDIASINDKKSLLASVLESVVWDGDSCELKINLIGSEK
ncbi:recombinase family protein [Clostridium botulinum]|uniref:Resolvase n=1 Tax=Clostridium botulinum C/D str. DC5 TaxID=1443128 RepID=A0A0A0ILW6_CLOBO|nr:recombinase family protein [Clostridium botulinum]KGN01953.1 resolvase [Clostridium botulinum C/D str. DC5]KOC55598.1 resolvase [Clostridium botulinum]KOC57505.1 resolvase [Clostridium botulinum]MCD3232715.1 recombinase family protein [Clostridium botulinum D/C]MCD3238577.1 recombinase family protein [Clostridium botulinum D/C]